MEHSNISGGVIHKMFLEDLVAAGSFFSFLFCSFFGFIFYNFDCPT